MERQEKLDILAEVLDNNGIEIIDTEVVCGIEIDELILDEDSDIYPELIGKGLTKEDVDELNEFFSNDTLILVDIGKISGITFNETFSANLLDEMSLWEEEE